MSQISSSRNPVHSAPEAWDRAGAVFSKAFFEMMHMWALNWPGVVFVFACCLYPAANEMLKKYKEHRHIQNDKH